MDVVRPAAPERRARASRRRAPPGRSSRRRGSGSSAPRRARCRSGRARGCRRGSRCRRGSSPRGSPRASSSARVRRAIASATGASPAAPPGSLIFSSRRAGADRLQLRGRPRARCRGRGRDRRGRRRRDLGEHRAHRSSPPPGVPGPRLMRARILIVDDDEASARSPSVLTAAGFEVIGADSAAAALGLLQAKRSTSSSPTSSCRRWTGSRLGAQIAVLALDTRVVYMSGRLPAHENTPGNVLEKPFTPSELVHAVESVLARRTSAPVRARAARQARRRTASNAGRGVRAHLLGLVAPRSPRRPGPAPRPPIATSSSRGRGRARTRPRLDPVHLLVLELRPPAASLPARLASPVFPRQDPLASGKYGSSRPRAVRTAAGARSSPHGSSHEYSLCGQTNRVAALGRDRVRLLDHPGGEVRMAEVAHLSLPHELIHCPEAPSTGVTPSGRWYW